MAKRISASMPVAIASAQPLPRQSAAAIGDQTLPARFPSLDGWRALSILMVLGEHSVYTYDFPPKYNQLIPTIFDGNLGVRFFFVISGFLITWLLLKEQAQTGAISVRRFYARRALRILPVYFTFLAVAFVLWRFLPLHYEKINWAANLTFTTNFFPLTWTTGHLWSLAVEEQFYLVWPVLLCLAGLQNTGRILSLLIVPVIVCPLCRMISAIQSALPSPDPFFQTYSSLNYFDSISFGCISAIVMLRYQGKLRALLIRFPGSVLLAGWTLIIVPQMLIKCFVAGSLTVPLGNTLQALGFSLLVLLSIVSPQYFKPLNWAPIRIIGILSYSVYIWQMLFCSRPEAYGLQHAWFLSFYGWYWAALLAAICSYYGLEKPLMSLRARFRPQAVP